MTRPGDSSAQTPVDRAARRREVAERLAAVRARITSACEASGRDPAEVTLVAVTKTFPADDVRLLADLGVPDIGESRAQEAVTKAAACADLDLTWHFVGQLQTNKVRAVLRFASVIHSVDRLPLVRVLAREVAGRTEPVHCLIQVRLDETQGRGGAELAQVLPLADAVAATPGLRLAGVMAVAPLDGDPAPAFARLADVAVGVRVRHADATWLSAGMSDDLEAAIGCGATHVRVGRGLLGVRPLNR
jgi:PLP dependent protein